MFAFLLTKLVFYLWLCGSQLFVCWAYEVRAFFFGASRFALQFTLSGLYVKYITISINLAQPLMGSKIGIASSGLLLVPDNEISLDVKFPDLNIEWYLALVIKSIWNLIWISQNSAKSVASTYFLIFRSLSFYEEQMKHNMNDTVPISHLRILALSCPGNYQCWN